jgi:hypothetical protein
MVWGPRGYKWTCSLCSGWQTFQFLTIEQFTRSLLSVQTKAVLCSQLKLASNLKLPFPFFLCEIGRRNKFWKLKAEMEASKDAIVDVIHDASMQSLLLLLLLLQL